MTDGDKDIRPSEAEEKDVVKLDKNSPVLQRARELMARAVIKKRMAMHAEFQPPDFRGSGAGDSAPDLWREMPLVAREHESSLEGGAEGGGSTQTGYPEFDDYGGVPAC